MKKAEKSIVYHAKDLMCILHINHNEAYALMRRKSFPSMQLGSTLIVKKNYLMLGAIPRMDAHI